MFFRNKKVSERFPVDITSGLAVAEGTRGTGKGLDLVVADKSIGRSSSFSSISLWSL